MRCFYDKRHLMRFIACDSSKAYFLKLEKLVLNTHKLCLDTRTGFVYLIVYFF